MVSALRGVEADPTQKEGMNPMTLLGRPLAALAVCAALLLSAGTALGAAGDPTIIVPINDAEAGGTYNLEFKRVYAGATPTGTPVYIYVPSGWTSGQVAGIAGIDPQFDPIPGDAFTPCATRPDSDYVITQTQINTLGDLLARQIVGVNEAHFGPIGLANASDPNSDSLVVLVYNVQDGYYYTVVQIISPCDLTPGATTTGEIVDPAGYVYRFEGDLIQAGPFDTSCLRGTKDSFTVAVSNMPSGELIVFDAEYLFRIIHGGAQPVKKK